MPFWWLLHYVDTWQHSQLFIVVRFQQPSHLTVAGGSYCAAGLHCVTNVTSAGCAGFCQTLSSWGRGGDVRAGLCPQKWSEAVGKFYMVLMFLQFWMWCFKIDFEYVNTPTVYLYPALALLSTTILTKRLCGTWHWNAGDEMCWDIIAGNCTQEPKFRSEIATSSPLFPMETTPSTPQHLLSSLYSSIWITVTIVCYTLWLILLTLLLQWHPSHFASNHLISNGCSLWTCWWPFFKYSTTKWQLWQAYLGRVVVFTASFLDEDVFINLSKWSTNQVGIAQPTQCCVFSRSSLCKAYRRCQICAWEAFWERKQMSIQRASCPWLPELSAGIVLTTCGALTRSLTTRKNRRT